MNITTKCADCGRDMGTQVVLGKQCDVTIEVHACYHGKLYGKDSTCTEEKEQPNETK